VLIKNSDNQRLNFSNMMTQSQVSLKTHDSSTASLVFNKPLKTKGNNVINMDNYSLDLKPFEKQKVIITLRSLCPEKVLEHFEVMVKDGQS